MIEKLYTPEQAAEKVGEDVIKASTIRRLLRTGKAECTVLARGKYALTEAQINTLIASLTKPVATPPPLRSRPTIPGQTSRSAARGRRT